MFVKVEKEAYNKGLLFFFSVNVHTKHNVICVQFPLIKILFDNTKYFRGPDQSGADF